MQASWFFATTPIPSRPLASDRLRGTRGRTTRRWWQRLVERYVVWGERTERGLPRWMYY